MPSSAGNLKVKVCPEVPALAEASWNALSTASDAERWMSTEAVSVASVGCPAAEAVDVWDLLSFPTRRSSDLVTVTVLEAPLAKSKVQSRFCPVLAAQSWPVPWSEKELT